MATAGLTTKGQVTIPAEVRRRMGIDAGDRIEFVELKEGGFLIKPAVDMDNVRSLKGLLRKRDKPVSVEEMNAAVRGRAGLDVDR
jgi:antitoxin PrlF